MVLKKKFRTYLASMNMTSTLIARVTEVFKFCQQICPEIIQDILVTEYVTGDKKREYESLICFSENFAVEARNFVADDVAELIPLNHPLPMSELYKTNYDFEKATEESRLQIMSYPASHSGATLTISIKASGQNCDHARDMYLKYLR